jgi:hypothetical protein
MRVKFSAGKIIYNAKSVQVNVQLIQHYKPAAEGQGLDIQLGICKFMTAFH